MNLLDALKKDKDENTILNTKGGKYYKSSLDANLDVFTMLNRYNVKSEVIDKFNNALDSDEELALANLLYLLDIRNGKGERRLFKTIYRDLCLNNPESALRILPFIDKLGRYDYILEGIGTEVESDTILKIKDQLQKDLESENPSLLAKWLPSLRTHNKNNANAKRLVKLLGMSEKEYRKVLTTLRTKLNIVEKSLTTKEYDNIIFSEVPAKAMIKYQKVYNEKMKEKFTQYKKEVELGKTKINTKGLFAYEIVKKVLKNTNYDQKLLNLMWENQKDILKGTNKNVLVVADTSGSMTWPDNLPYANSIGLAIYTAEHNTGFFKNHFITFSEEPKLQKIKGRTIAKKIENIECIVANTNIDKVFKLILDTSLKNKLTEEELPSHIIIISDMEFDQGVYSKEDTNFNGWKKAFSKKGYTLPKIIFWNVAGSVRGIPVTKQENDVAMISGFSTNILENILDLEEINPYDVMLEKLSVYLELLKD